MTSAWQQLGQRASFTNRISTMFERRRAPSQAADSVRATTTFEVPLFLSPSRYEPPRAYGERYRQDDIRSQSSRQSLIEAATPATSRSRSHPISASSRYSSPAASPAIPHPPVLPLHEPSLLSSTHAGETDSTGHRTIKDPDIRRKRRRRSALKLKVQAKKRLSIVFGITLLLTLITYLVLAATQTATGVMFHVMLILLVLSLAGVFAHSIIRFFVLRKHVQNRRIDRRRAENRPSLSRNPTGSSFGATEYDMAGNEGLDPEKPVRIMMAEDEEAGLVHRFGVRTTLQPPPPVYGNFRSSKRINPDLVHWQKVPPSPLTPTYDEAMSDIHRAVGYRPPSYIESESGATRVADNGQQDVDIALQDIHPLERERMAQSTHNFI